MKFKIPMPKMPTEQEMTEVAMQWWDRQHQVSFWSWNQVLLQNSYPLRICQLPPDLLRETIDLVNKYSDDKLRKLVPKYDEIISKSLSDMDCEDSYFAKLISRSPKDFLSDDDNHTKPRPTNCTSDLIISLVSSMRCFEDIILLSRLPEISALVLRPYVKFHAKDEWRVLVQDGNVMGISQYYYQSYFPELTTEHVASVSSRIRQFINEIALPNLKTNTFCADFIVDESSIKILETNPYGISDPCLFKSYDALDGSIKWSQK